MIDTILVTSKTPKDWPGAFYKGVLREDVVIRIDWICGDQVRDATEIKILLWETERFLTCASLVDVLDKFLVRESLSCSDDMETVYYSALVDGTHNAPLVCYSCADQCVTVNSISKSVSKIWRVILSVTHWNVREVTVERSGSVRCGLFADTHTKKKHSVFSEYTFSCVKNPPLPPRKFYINQRGLLRFSSFFFARGFAPRSSLSIRCT